MRTSRSRKRSRALTLLEDANEDHAPELSLLNLVDLMLVFAVGLLLAIASYYGLRDLMLEPEAVVVVHRSGTDDMEMIIKRSDRVERMRMTPKSINGQGTRIGIAYRLNSGEIVYVPETPGSLSTDSARAAPEGIP